MKIIAFAIYLVATCFIQTVAGLHCDSRRAACWKDGSPGVDTKFNCNYSTGDCGEKCPPGYSGIHCAEHVRCVTVPSASQSRLISSRQTPSRFAARAIAARDNQPTQNTPNTDGTPPAATDVIQR